MAWKVEGRYFENCSCDVPCPCTVSLDAYTGDYVEVRLYGARGAELARESLYEDE